jgi:large subunit ribosomal protein L15
MQIHQFSPARKKRVQRIGRSGKRGSYSGRGVKGQHSRSGRKLRPAERDLIIRLPKLRGFANKSKSEKPTVFNLDDIEFAIKRGDVGKSPVVLNAEFLKQRGLLPKGFNGVVKILGDGEMRVPARVEGLRLSKSAKAKIEKAGGSIKS